MTERTRTSRIRSPLKLERNLALIFAVLGMLLTGLIALHWLLVLEPALRVNAESRSYALAQAQAHRIEKVLGAEDSPERILEALRTQLDEILLLTDRATATPFIHRIDLVLDYDLLAVPPLSLDMTRGDPECGACFVAEIPLYHPGNHLLVGIATFHSTPTFLRTLIADVRSKLIWGGGAMLVLIALAWIGSSRVLRRLARSEGNLRNLFEAAPFPIVLNVAGQHALTEANAAAQRYLELRRDASGRLCSDAWRALRAAGLPEQPGQSREMMIPGPGGAERWVLVSSTPVTFSGRPGNLLSLVDVTTFKATQDRLHQASMTDPLTGLYNRRHLLAQLTREIELARSLGLRLAVILLDLDHFKSVNDTLGHRMGDEVLRRVAQTINTSVREGDVAGRYGGEEFLVILPRADSGEALAVAERIRIAVRSLHWSQPELRMTISGGVSAWQGTDLDALIESADRRLYEAKEAGRDRIIGDGGGPTGSKGLIPPLSVPEPPPGPLSGLALASDPSPGSGAPPSAQGRPGGAGQPIHLHPDQGT